MKKSLMALIVVGSFLLSACALRPDTIVNTPLTARPQAASTIAPPANGAIFQAAAYRPMFEDRRARLIGDTITIVINEKSSAGKQAGSAASKTGSVTASAPNVFGLLGSLTNRLSASGSNAIKYEDKGAVTSSNNFISTMTVTVIDVLSNGNLIVAGEKQVSLDKGSEFIRFSGVVDPSTVNSGNIVSSTQVADAKIEYRTNSTVDGAEVASMLARFFLSVLPL
ncbi:Flagellar L-ring protein precursor (Basal body L-ring protein) [Herminiimonas arsenicoxydans]|uniref:Flagellar L-ring protein n=1 Tax=Herminiimonas arsenicoxydans TaxID=204773 RepID=FLGH_HERAR|nr:RecName: Full=Flagellar L-ring protein; AltName: Full=Basal body L-ring protein; Flags: Precursor [Herminiimonas arsenicoxydans]CAL62045.1 Flagellar L-ring protein precursor (Basal body L-ring protein) [Herminiimonas arsenicoxydans]